MSALLLDLDETLIHEHASTQAAYAATVADAAALAGFSPAAVVDGVRAAAARLWAAGPHAAYCRRIGISSWEGLWATFALGDDPDTVALRGFAPDFRRRAWREGLRAVGIADEDLVADLAERFVWERGRRQIPFPETLGVLSALRGDGHRLVLLTNGDRDLQRRKLAGSGLLPLLDGVVISGALGVGKPAPAIFAHALEVAGSAAADAVMVGDSAERDVAGAEAAGIRAVWLARGRDDPPPAAAWRVLPDLRGLPALLR